MVSSNTDTDDPVCQHGEGTRTHEPIELAEKMDELAECERGKLSAWVIYRGENRLMVLLHLPQRWRRNALLVGAGIMSLIAVGKPETALLLMYLTSML